LEVTRAILAATADGIVTTDARGAIKTWNAAAHRIFGYGADEIAGKTLATLTRRPHDEEHDADARQSPRTGIPGTLGRSIEAVGHRKDGTTFPLEILAIEFHYGKSRGFVVVIRDITRRKSAEEQERRHYAELSCIRNARFAGELGVGIAHEVNQPLTTVTNTLAACEVKVRNRKASRREILVVLRRATKEVLRAARIVRDLRDLARGHVAVQDQVDLHRAIRCAVALVVGQLEQDRIALHVVLGHEPLLVRGNCLEIEHVLMNMISNAADSIRESAATVREVTVSAAPSADGTAAEVAVRDTGVGIPAAAVERLFDPFFTTKPRGLGMGLAICHSIIEAHGGRVWVAPGDNRPGATAIRFTIPLAAPARRSTARRRVR
jgi:two-component system sensor kinase FixL